ncbi:hypothetical protein [Novosphingobium sediminicola]|uniref:Uncharacterized protein n=1 Tax=Novosphingobium sediminicola TaxID=563162 RepID=A0A7W6G619_9SPHN|nr:hypothetical protein [Novosphingobium sediminicola]MBB3953502.1 hypothetical protein [Novosphingobium sediminicola]
MAQEQGVQEIDRNHGSGGPPALPLPSRPEPLVKDRPLPRHLSLARPSVGLTAAMGAWIGSMGRMLVSGFIVRQQREVPLSLRERTEITQLRAENRRLREKLQALERQKSD